jgi:hypothetical protein
MENQVYYYSNLLHWILDISMISSMSEDMNRHEFSYIYNIFFSFCERFLLICKVLFNYITEYIGTLKSWLIVERYIIIYFYRKSESS